MFYANMTKQVNQLFLIDLLILKKYYDMLG